MDALAPSPAYIQQGSKVLPVGATGKTAFGIGVDLSAQGTTGIVGGYAHTRYTGAAWIVTRSGSRWTSNRPPIIPDDARPDDRVGQVVAMSGNGQVVLVAGRGGWIFEKVGSQWVQRGSRLLTGAFVLGVALSFDGSTAIIPGSLTGVGGAFVFTRSGSQWTQAPEPLSLPADASNPRDVALSGDGATAVVLGYRVVGTTASGNEARMGAAWVFKRSGETWTRIAQLDPPAGYNVAQSVALSTDGRTILVGSNARAWFYTRAGDAWTFRATATSPSGTPGSNFGEDVAISGNGAVALIGGHNYLARADRSRARPNVGAAWVFARVGAGWRQTGSMLRARDFDGPATFGDSVALSDDGRIAAVGGPSDTSGATTLALQGRGAAWFFSRQAGR